jgi:phosphoribosylformylglycinamidine synthase
MCGSKNVPIHKIGVTGGDALIVNEAVISLEQLRQAHTNTFPRLFS